MSISPMSFVVFGLSLVIMSLTWPILIGGAPYVAASRDAIRRALKLAALKPGETVLDLGCGDGRALRIAAEEFGAVGKGIEIDPLRVWWARWLCRRWSEINVKQGNIFDAAWGQYDVVFLFLCEDAVRRLSPRLKAELSPGSRVVCYGFTLPGWEVAATQENCFLYAR